MDLTSIQPFADTFGKKMKRKKPKLAEYDFGKMLDNIDERSKKYNITEDKMSLTFVEKEKEFNDET